jgi:hypothetical protein
MSEPAGSGPPQGTVTAAPAVSRAPADTPGPGTPEGLNPVGEAAPSVQKDAPDDLTPDEERTLSELLEKRQAAKKPGTLQLRVEGSHSAMIHGGVTVGNDWTDVPEHMVAALFTAADNAGVTLTQKEG